MRLIPAFVLAAALAAPASAADWRVDHDRSTLAFTFTAQGSPVSAVFKEWTAAIAFDPADLSAANARVVISLMSANSGSRERDGMMASKSWFDVKGESFAAPEGAPPGSAVFQTTAFRQTGETTYEADGTLTLRDVTKGLTLPFTLVIDGAEAHMTASVTLDRNDWGVGQGQYAGEDPVATAVSVEIDLYAAAQ